MSRRRASWEWEASEEEPGRPGWGLVLVPLTLRSPRSPRRPGAFSDVCLPLSSASLEGTRFAAPSGVWTGRCLLPDPFMLSVWGLPCESLALEGRGWVGGCPRRVCLKPGRVFGAGAGGPWSPGRAPWGPTDSRGPGGLLGLAPTCLRRFASLCDTPVTEPLARAGGVWPGVRGRPGQPCRGRRGQRFRKRRSLSSAAAGLPASPPRPRSLSGPHAVTFMLHQRQMPGPQEMTRVITTGGPHLPTAQSPVPLSSPSLRGSGCPSALPRVPPPTGGRRPEGPDEPPLAWVLDARPRTGLTALLSRRRAVSPSRPLRVALVGAGLASVPCGC